MSHYDKHVFFCVNQREAGADCCHHAGASELQAYAKDKLKSMKPSQAGRIRINRAGCLVDATTVPSSWSSRGHLVSKVFDRADIDEIIENISSAKLPVDRLRI